MAFMRPWSPFRELESFRHTFDDMIERMRGKAEPDDWALKPPIESFVEEGRLIVRTELAGVDPKDVSVSVMGDVLTIHAQRHEEHETKKRDFLSREFKYGSMERSITLPKGVKAEDIKASFANGLLELSAPMPKELVSKEVKIHIEHAEAQPAEPKPAEKPKAA